MLCEACGVEMRILRAANRARQGEDGRMQVVHVSDVRCLNPRCESRNAPHEVATVLWESPGAVDPKVYGEGQ